MPADPADLVIDLPDDFRVHSDAYISPEIFELEMQRIFERSWVLRGARIPDPRAGRLSDDHGSAPSR